MLLFPSLTKFSTEARLLVRRRVHHSRKDMMFMEVGADCVFTDEEAERDKRGERVHFTQNPSQVSPSRPECLKASPTSLKSSTIKEQVFKWEPLEVVANLIPTAAFFKLCVMLPSYYAPFMAAVSIPFIFTVKCPCSYRLPESRLLLYYILFTSHHFLSSLYFL